MSAPGEWQSFSRDALSRLPAEAATWTTALARLRARLPSVVTIAVKGVGEVEIRPDQVAFAEEGVARDGMSWFPLESAGRRTWVGADQRIALALVAGVLGGSAPLVVRPLGPVERGLMAAILLSALDALGVSQRVQLGLGAGNGQPDPAQLPCPSCGEPASSAHGLLACAPSREAKRSERGGMASGGPKGMARPSEASGEVWRVGGRRAERTLPGFPYQNGLAIGGSIRTAAGLGGRALLIIPVEWLADAANPGPVLGRLDRLVASATLELGRTALPGAAVVAAATGDAVVFEGIPGVDPDGSWPAWLRVGDFVAATRLGPDGALAMVGPFSQAEEEFMASQDEKPRWIPVEPSSPEVASLVANALVEVFAEIGRIALRGDELAGLMKGGVLSLGSRPADAIQLRVGGQLWAAGELVTLGDELGVRILKLHAG